MVRLGPAVLARGLANSLALAALLAASSSPSASSAPPPSAAPSPAPPISRSSPIAQDEEAGKEELPPANIGLEEEVEVRITQIELSAWPKDDDVQACLDLDVSDFELLVNGEPREILAIDRLHEYGLLLPPTSVAAIQGEGPEPQTTETADEDAEPPVIKTDEVDSTRPATATDSKNGEPVVSTPTQPRDPMQFVFYFDTWHLNLFTNQCKALSQPLAFSWVRKMLEEEFQPGDRVMLASFTGWPNIHTGWVEDREMALDLLDELEATPGFMFPVRGQHLDRWLQGWMVLFQALGLTPGRKHLFYLGDDINWNPTGTLLNTLAGRAQANKVLVHSVDLIWTCRLRLPSFLSTPYNLGKLPTHTGGRMFGTGQTVSRAVNTLRRLQACRFRLSFRNEPGDSRRRRPAIRVKLNRKDIRLAAPVSFEDRPPTLREKSMALAILPRWEQGLRVDAALWPLHPAGKKKRWNALLMAWFRRTGASDTSESLNQITVEANAIVGSKYYASYYTQLDAEAMNYISHDPTGYLQIFPVKVKSGAVDIVVAAQDAHGTLGASVRSTFVIPAPPRPGKAHPWMLLDGLMSLQGQKTVRPSFTSAFPPSRPPWFLGYGCPPLGEGEQLPPGWLVSGNGQEGRTVELRWLGQGWGVDANETSCGWLLGELAAPLPEGLWTFDPPAAFVDDKEGLPSLHFRIKEEDDD